jgi:hypothetical protein
VTFDFTYHSYTELLRYLIEDLGRAIVPLRNAPETGAYVILRHDIDCSMAKAREMAELEHRLGISATVFVLVTSEYYNLMLDENVAAMRAIAAMGHEIGLHYDTAALPGQTAEERAQVVVKLARFLEDYAGVPITSVAQHNPSLTDVRLTIPGFRDAYERRFFTDIAYLSDSRRMFGTADVFQFFRAHERSQLLVHPLWYHDRVLTRRESFDAIRAAADRVVAARLDEMTAEMEEHDRRLRSSDTAGGS